MASQYNLQLKAILDTTQVKQELQKLRSMQQQALGKGNQNTSNVQNGSNNLGNLNALNSTLGKLNASINQLNNTIAKLNVNTSKLSNTSNTKQSFSNSQSSFQAPLAVSRPQVSSGGNGIMGKMGNVISSSVADFNTQRENAETYRRLRNIYKSRHLYSGNKISPAGWADAWYNGTLGMGVGRNAALQMAQHQHNGVTPLQTMIQNPHLFRSTLNNLNPNKVSLDAIKQAGGFALMGVGQIMNAGANYAMATGDTQAAKNLQAGGTVAGMAGTGAMVGSVFGPIGTGVGAAIGTVVGGVTAAFDYLAQSTQEIAEEMKKYSEMIKEAANIDRTNVLQTQQKDILKHVESGDIDTLTKRKTALQKEYDDIVKRQNEIVPEGQLEDYSKKFADLKKRFLEAKEESNFVEEWFGLEDAEIEERLRKQYKKEKPQFEKNYEEYSDLQKRRQEILQEQQIIEQGLGVLEGRKKSSSSQTSSLGDVLSDLSRNKFIESFSGMSRKDLDEYLKHYEGRVEASKSSYRDNLLKAQEITGVSDSDIKKREDLLKAANASKRDLSFNESVVNEIKRNIDNDNILNSSIGSERTQIRLFNEAQSNQKTINSGNEDDVRQKRDQYKDRADTARDNYLYYLKKAETAQTPEEKKEAYDIAMQSKKRWEFDKSQFDQLNSSLTQIMVAPLQDALSKLTAPSMENVNSLAGQGLMINRADDSAREQAMEDYEREQTELQRQIKDILQQNETTPKKSIIL